MSIENALITFCNQNTVVIDKEVNQIPVVPVIFKMNHIRCRDYSLAGYQHIIRAFIVIEKVKSRHRRISFYGVKLSEILTFICRFHDALAIVW